MKKTIIFVSLFVIISGLFSCQFGKNLSTPSPAEWDTTENVEETKFAEKTIEDATETWSDEASVDIETHVETIVPDAAFVHQHVRLKTKPIRNSRQSTWIILKIIWKLKKQTGSSSKHYLM